ncbi:MAG TPA: DUF484 family protein [Sphingomicrobium sp.]|nr:DUF484 family protein [Sphingomicrobium sp.]
MGRVHSFDDHAVARLRDRLGAAETARADLLAFARGHSEAVATIHHAILHTLDADGIEAMLGLVAEDWPGLLGVDLAIIAVVVGDQGFRVDRNGTTLLNPAIIDRAASITDAVCQAVERGNALFGNDAGDVRTEALVPIGADDTSLPRGLLLLGHRSPVDPGSTHGAELLRFLGDFLAAMMRRWLTLPNPGPPTMEPTQPAR